MEKRWIWPFELEEQIGSGAMGVVYRARFVKNDRRVALKLLPPDIAANPTLAARFQREMELLKDLRHPNIVHCFGGTCEGDQWFYAMELIEGGTLASLIQEQGRLPWRETVEFGLQTCAALEHAHERGIVHRDLKPGNLLVTKSGKLKLSDFGLAQMAAETKLTAAGKTVGSLHYMAPEQIQGRPPMSNRTDLYALGCVLYEMLTGRPPFLGGTMAEVLQRHIKETPQPVASVAFDCPPQLEALVAELLAKDPEQRPPDAMTVARRLREIDQAVTIKLPRSSRHRPVESPQTETISTDVVRASAGPVNRWFLAGLIVIGLLTGWLIASRFSGGGDSRRADAALVAGMRDPNMIVRQFAMKCLADAGADPKVVVPELLQALTDPDPMIRTEAAKTIGKIGPGGHAVLGPLRKVQKEDDIVMVRDAAAQAEKDLQNFRERGSWFPAIATLFALSLLTGSGVWVWRKVAI